MLNVGDIVKVAEYEGTQQLYFGDRKHCSFLVPSG